MAEKSIHQLPSIQNLIKESWGLFKKTFLTYLKFVGLILAFFFLGALIGVLIALPMAFTAFSTHLQLAGTLTPFQIITFILLILWGILYILSVITISLIFPIVSIFILQGKKKDASLMELIKQSKPLILPYFLTMLLSGSLIFGGMVIFVIPGLLISFFFVFVSYAVILEKKSGLQALSHSYQMIKQHFWEILGRFLLLEIGLIVISSILQRSTEKNFLMMLVYTLFSLLSGWYARSYIFLLYKQVREKTEVNKFDSLRWVLILSGIGWLLLILFIIASVAGVIHLPWMEQGRMHPLINKTV